MKQQPGDHTTQFHLPPKSGEKNGSYVVYLLSKQIRNEKELFNGYMKQSPRTNGLLRWQRE